MDAKIQIIAQMKEYLKTCASERLFLRDKSAFCRQPTLNFERVALFLLSLPKLSLAISLDSFLEECFDRCSPVMSKSSLSKARYKLRHTFFAAWNKVLIKLVYQKLPLRRWKGHLVLGVDGSSVITPDTDDTRSIFGLRTNQHGQGAMARCLACYDVLNRFCVRSVIIPYGVSERAVAYKWASRLSHSGIYIFDRGFASFAHFWLLNRYDKLFVIRCGLSFNNEVKNFVASDTQSSIVDLTISDKAYKTLRKMNISVSKSTTVTVRLVKVILDDGSIEVLITNLLDDNKYSTDCFKELYFKRWGVEVFFDEFKNQLQVEIFSGRKAEAVKQEFYASVFVYNLQSLLLADCRPEMEKKNQGKATPRQINRNISFGLLKIKIIQIFLLSDPSQILENLKIKFLRNTVAVKPNRSNPRNKNRKRQRNNFRPNSNFARAA